MDTRRIAVAPGVELATDLWPARADAARGPTFLLVHGLASNARLWDGVADRLAARGHAAVTVDLRGHGRSSKPGGPYDVPAVADDLATLVAALGIDRPIVAGQSWGGNVVLELAAGHPGLVRGLVCVDGGWLEPSRTFPSWEACRDVLAPPRLAGRPLAEIERHIRAAHPDWPEVAISGTLANFERRADGTIAPWLTFDHHILVLRGLWDHHPSQRYRAVSAPVLLLPVDNGRHDAEAERRRADVREALAALPAARLRAFEGDHDLHAQHPVEIADAMADAVDDGFLA